MRILIPTKKYQIVEELSKPFPKNPAISEIKTKDSIVVSLVGHIIGEVHCWGLERTQEAIWYCKSCGCEPYAVWPNPSYALLYHGNSCDWYDYAMKNEPALQPYYERDRMLKEFETAVHKEKSSIKVCPVCGSPLTDHFFFKNGNTTNSEILESYKKAEAYALSCDIPVTVRNKTDEIVSIKTSTKKLQEYLLILISIEKNIRSIKQRLFVLYSLNNEITRKAKFAQLYPVMIERKAITVEIEKMQSELQKKKDELFNLEMRRDHLARESFDLPKVSFPVKPIEPPKPTYATPNIFNKKRVIAENKAKAEQYNNEITQYNKALAEYPTLLEAAKKQQECLHKKALEDKERELHALDKLIAEKTSALEKYKIEIEEKQTSLENKIKQLETKKDYPEVQLKSIIDDEISNVENLLTELYKRKHQLYATDIIFGKYRDLTSLTSFYEYLLSGRCEVLEGTNGCYNLYESELRANIIINKLDAIGDSLEQIKNNQFTLYTKLCEINTELNTINTTTTAMINCMQETTETFLEHSAVIAYNSAISAYYSKINAEIAGSERYISMICW